MVWQMWVVFALIGATVALYASEKFPMEVVSIAAIAALLLLFHFAPLPAGDGVLDARRLLAGFADPALITVLSLMVVGQALTRTGALEEPIHALLDDRRPNPALLVGGAFITVAALSAFLNNTPVVIVFIPVLAALAERLDVSSSRVMLPLSFAAILGGMTTLIGSSTNLLAAGTYRAMGGPALGFFDFAVPGLFLAVVGLVYVLLVLPRLLPDRAPYTEQLVGDGRQYIAQISVATGSPLDGEAAVAGMFRPLAGMTVRLVQRGGHAHLPPFEDLSLRPGDIVVVAATRASLTKALASMPGLVGGDDADTRRDPVLAEAMVSPGSRLVGRNLRQVGFHFHTGCVVMGVQRRSRMLRSSMDDIRLESGDVLLIHGPREQIEQLRASHEVLLMEWSAHDLPVRQRARLALLVFLGVVAAAASGVVPIVIAAVTGAAAMVLTGCLNVHQAARAIDRRVALLVAAALALGTALEVTGGAAQIAHLLINATAGMGPAVTLSALFAIIAVLTNVLSNNATAVLFTPIAIQTAHALEVDPLPFLFTVIFAANCSFATPMGYQTNLLVMGPGHYRFADFLRGGVPLIILLWVCFSAFAPWYYDL